MKAIRALILFLTSILLITTVTAAQHNCRLYGSIGISGTELETYLINGTNSLKNLAETGNIDGWGIASYDGGIATFDRGAIRAFNDPDFNLAVSEAEGSDTILAHVRACTTGCCDRGEESIDDPHPFSRTYDGKTYTFIHNGEVSKTRLEYLIDNDYLSTSSPFGSSVLECSTADPYDNLVVDSELYFLYVMEKIDETGDVTQGIAEAVKSMLSDGETGAMNFILSDGESMWAFRRDPTGEYTLNYIVADGEAAVASVVPDDSNWTKMDNYELVKFSKTEVPYVINDIRTYIRGSITEKFTFSFDNDINQQIFPLAGDVDADGDNEIVFAGGTVLYVIDGTTGDLEWSLPGGDGKAVELVDLDNDGTPEIVQGTDNLRVRAINGNGTIRWTSERVSGSSQSLLPLIAADIDGDKHPEIYYAASDAWPDPYTGNIEDYRGTITMLDYEGNILRSTWILKPCWSGMALGDTDFDGEFELYLGDRRDGYHGLPGNGLQKFNAHTLEPIWERPDLQHSSPMPQLADVLGDSNQEVIGQDIAIDGPLIIDSDTGTSIIDYSDLRLPTHASATTVDIDKDGNYEMFFATSYPSSAPANFVVFDLVDGNVEFEPTFNYHFTWPPTAGDVLGDGSMEILAAAGNQGGAGDYPLIIYDKEYNLVEEIDFDGFGQLMPTRVFDTDNDGLNEIVVVGLLGQLAVFDTEAVTPNPAPRSWVQWYSEARLGAAEYIPPPGPTGPIVKDELPADGSNIETLNPDLSVYAADFTSDTFDITFEIDVGFGYEELITLTDQSAGTFNISSGADTYDRIYNWRVTIVGNNQTVEKEFAFYTIQDDTLLKDSGFDASATSIELRDDSIFQDWYESRDDDPELLVLDETDIAGNDGKKAAFIASSTGNAYLSQEFNVPQTGTFSVEWDIYVDEILNISIAPDRAAWMLIGDDTDSIRGPSSTNDDRFTYLAFAHDGGATDGTMDLVARDRDDGWTSFTTVTTGLNLDQWYNLRLDLDLDAYTYDVYIDDVYQATITSRVVKDSVTHISFAQWNDGAGTFYVDNVREATCIPTRWFEDNDGDTYGNPAVSVDACTAPAGYVADADDCDDTNGDINPGADEICNGFDDNCEGLVDEGYICGDSLLIDNDFEASIDDEDLRVDGSGRDWYESRGDFPGGEPNILRLNQNDVSENSGKKAEFFGYTSPGDAYLTQRFLSAQFGSVVISFDIFIDEILNDRSDRTAYIFLGNDDESTTLHGPTGTSDERYTFLAFYDSSLTNGGEGLEVRAREYNSPVQDFYDTSTWTQVATGLEYQTWYDIDLVLDIPSDTYDLYIDGELIAEKINKYQNYDTSYITYMSFANFEVGSGHFFVDNVEASECILTTYYLDFDEDGYGDSTDSKESCVLPAGYVSNADDCDDTDGNVNPGESESMNWIDDNCNGAIDEAPEVGLLNDQLFSLSTNSEELKDNGVGQDWYESRGAFPGGEPELLVLNEDDIGGNDGKKAAILGSTPGDVYLTQEFSSAQFDKFGVTFDIYIDEIVDDVSDRTAHIFIGNNQESTTLHGPTGTSDERFTFLAFYDSSLSNGGEGLEIRAREYNSPVHAFYDTSTWRQVATGLEYDTWYNIKIILDVSDETYDLYVDDVLVAEDINRYQNYDTSFVTYISFANYQIGSGTFYVDNVHAY